VGELEMLFHICLDLLRKISNVTYKNGEHFEEVDPVKEKGNSPHVIGYRGLSVYAATHSRF
jgi:hypothetical protein